MKKHHLQVINIPILCVKDVFVVPVMETTACNNKDLASPCMWWCINSKLSLQQVTLACGTLMYQSCFPPGLPSVSLSAIATVSIYSHSTQHVVAISYLACSPASANISWPSLQNYYVADIIGFLKQVSKSIIVINQVNWLQSWSDCELGRNTATVCTATLTL